MVFAASNSKRLGAARSVPVRALAAQSPSGTASSISHGMRGADGNGDGVDACRLDEGCCRVRIGADPLHVDAVLAAELAELGFDEDASGVRLLGDGSCRCDLLLVGQRRRIDQRRAEARCSCLSAHLSSIWSPWPPSRQTGGIVRLQCAPQGGKND